MTEFIHYDLTTAYRKKATAMVMRCSKCLEKFVSHQPSADVQICERCSDGKKG